VIACSRRNDGGARARGASVAVTSCVNLLHLSRVAFGLSTLTAVFLPVLAVCSACSDTSDAPASTVPDAVDSDAAEPADAGSDGSTACGSDVVAAPGLVVTDHGAVRGAREGGVYAYRNIPFAAPPVGALRWKPPSAASCWSGIREGAAWGPICPQSDAKGTAPIAGSEDCLQLNVFAPADKPGPLPIMVWIHGGGHVTGSAANELSGIRTYDGGALATKEGVIVVTINYRLGALGFLAHPTLAAEDPDRSEGNYGTLDQLAALRWVKANAAAIGGDASRVTIFGESAGAVSVCTLVASPLAKGLFSGAIMQSGGCVAKARTDAEAFGAKVFAAAKCETAADPLACMRALGAEAVVGALPVDIDIAGAAAAGYGSVDDGYVVPGKPLEIIAAGGHVKVPMIVGSNSDETSRSVPIPPTATAAQYEAAVRTLLGAHADPVLAAYPAADYPSPWKAYVALTTDVKFGCSARKTLRALSKSSTPAYRYYFSHALDTGPAAKLGAWHGVDVLYVFDHLAIGGYVPGAGDKTVADAMMHRWASFARNPADPNGAQAPAWPAYAAASDPYLELASPVVTGTALRTPQCDFWDAFVP
jgi:para-nitrobenzyl esterase